MQLNHKINALLQIIKAKALYNVRLVNTLTGLLCLILFGLCGKAALKLKTEYSLKQFYPVDHPLLVQEQKLRTLFRFDKNLSVLLVLKTSDGSSWLQDKNYQLLSQIQTSFAENSNLKSIVSIASIKGATSSADEVSVGNIFDNMSLAKREQLSKKHPFVKPHLLVKDNSATLMILNLKEATPIEVHDYTEKLRKYFALNYSALKVEFGGLPVVQADISVLLKKELLRSLGLGFLLFVAGLLLVYKKSTSVIPVFVTLIFVNTVVLGSLAFFGVSLNVLLTTLPVLISLDALSLVIHIQSHFLQTKNLWQTYRQLFWENLLAVTTTGMGFLMLQTSSSGLIKDYGLIVGISSLAVWFLVHVALVPLLAIFKTCEFRDWIHRPAYWSLWSIKNRKPVLIGSLFIFFFGFYSLTQINWNSRILDDLPDQQQTRITTEFIDQKFGGTLEANFVLTNGSTWQKPIALKKLDSAIGQIKNLASVGSVVSVTDFYKSLSQGPGQRLPSSMGELAEQNFMFSLSAINPLDNFISQNQKNVLIQVRYKDQPSDKINLAKENIVSILKNMFPNSEISFFGFGTQFHTINQEVSKSLVFNFWHALLAIGIVLAFVFRSWRWAALACLPNMIPPLVLFIFLNVNQVSMKPSVAIIFSIAIGLAFTNTVYVLGRVLKLQRSHKYESYFPLKKALLEESNACLLATTLVVLGFVVFLFSYFGMNRMFGQYMILSVVAALFGDLIFLPSLLFQFRKYFMGLALVIIMVKPISLFASGSEAAEMLKKSQALLSSKDDSAMMTMNIIETDGSKKERQLLIKRKFSDKKNFVLVKIQKPVDQKGAGLLTVIEKDSEQHSQHQWLYLPSSKQVRRFVSKNKQEGVMGSELSPQDLDLSTVQSSEAQLLKKMKVGLVDVALIEVKSKSNKTDYSKAVLWMDQKQFLPLRIEYFGLKGVVIKRIDFQNYKAFGGVFRAQKIIIKNLENKRGTDLLLSQVKVNSGLSDSEFTQRALSKD